MPTAFRLKPKGHCRQLSCFILSNTIGTLQENIPFRFFTKWKLIVPNLTLLTLAFCVQTPASLQISLLVASAQCFFEKYTSVIFFDLSYISWLLESRKRPYFSIFRKLVSVQAICRNTKGRVIFDDKTYHSSVILKKLSFQTRAFSVWFPRASKLKPQENDSALDNFTDFFELI